MEDKVLRENDNVRMIPISYGMHGFVIRVFNASANGLSMMFQEHVNHNTGYWFVR
jgi:hypothetical protein